MLASDVCSLVDVPNALSCRMDSVAVRWSDFEHGMPDTSGWQRGREWEFANTGIAMPEGFDTAIVIEHVTLSDDLSSISFAAAPSRQYAGTSAIGSKIARGSVLARAGQVLTPLIMSSIASGNVRTVEVVCKPRVAFIPTGGELVRPADAIPQGKNIETNSVLLSEKIKDWGGEPVVWDIVPDDPALIREAVVSACSCADIVVLNAGSSKGSDDWNVEMLEEVGEVLYHQTNHGPGHHSSGAVVDGTVVVGISGPPGGASFTADFYLHPVMMKFLGQPCHMKKVVARLASAIPSGGPGRASKRDQGGLSGEDRPSVVKEGGVFYGVRQMRLSVGADGVLEAHPATSAHLPTIDADAMDGYFMMASNKPAPEPGQIIEVDVRP